MTKPAPSPDAPPTAEDPSRVTLPPERVTAIPGPGSIALAERLARVESRNVTALDPPPIFWERARGANLWDVDGNRYVDLTAAFGVSNAGHAHPDVSRAVATQAEVLLHGMGGSELLILVSKKQIGGTGYNGLNL